MKELVTTWAILEERERDSANRAARVSFQFDRKGMFRGGFGGGLEKGLGLNGWLKKEEEQKGFMTEGFGDVSLRERLGFLRVMRRRRLVVGLQRARD